MSCRPALARVVRSGLVECVHTGSVVALEADGSVAFTLGDPTAPVYPRSANKPLQAVGLLRAGAPLDGALLALAAASHSGERIHVDGVRRVLRRAGLAESYLQTPPDLPLGERARDAWVRAGRGPEPIAMGCSGKHAGMLAACTANGWPVDSYLDPGHRLQVVLRRAIEELAAERIGGTGVDGCGAPLFALSLTGLARAYRELVRLRAGSPESRVADAMRAYPHYVGGTGRDVTRLIAGVPGLVAKDGMEGVYAAALPDGRAVALKIDDGSDRARTPVMAAALQRLGARAPVLEELSAVPVLGGGQVVGELRATAAIAGERR